MPAQKIDPKVIFASDAPAIDKPPVFSDKTKGWDVARANDGRPEIKQMNKMQQDTDLKILWLNENAVLPYDSTIDYPDGAVTLKDGSFKQLSSGAWVEFLDDFADKDAVKRGIANRHDSSLTYNSGERVVLTNGDIVKSTVNGNTNDPNVSMTGWVSIGNTKTVLSIAELTSIKNPTNRSTINVVGYYTGSLVGGGDFLYSAISTLTADGGIVFDCPDGGKWIRLHSGSVSFYEYGAKLDNSTDDTDAIKRALSNTYCKRIEHYEAGIAVITADMQKMQKNVSVKMGSDTWIRIDAPLGGIMVFMPHNDCELSVNIDGGQLPLSGNVSDEWIGSNNFGIFTTVPEHPAAEFANVNVKNVKVHNCKFKNIASPVRGDGAKFWDVAFNHFEKIKQSGVLMGASTLGSVEKNKIHHNTFVDMGDVAAACNQINGLDSKSGTIAFVSMTNNYAQNTQLRTGGCPFDFEGVTNVGESYGHIISNNIVHQIDGTTITDLNMRGLAICGSNVKNVTISNNSIRGSGASQNLAVHIDNTVDCVVSGNTIINSYGGGVSLYGSTGAVVSSNTIVDSQGSSINSPAIKVMVAAANLRTTNFVIAGNTISTTNSYVRTGSSSAIAVNCGVSTDATNLRGVIKGNTIRNANGSAISLVGVNARSISCVDITDNSVFTDYDLPPIDIDRAFDINVDGLYSRGGRGIRVYRADGESVRLSNLDISCTGLLFDIGGCLNLKISDSKVITKSTSIFTDTNQFIDSTKNNTLRNVSGSINSNNNGRGVIVSASTPVAHGLSLPPKSIQVTPMIAGVSGLRVYGITSTNFYIEYSGVTGAEFMWSASL